jgi:hypothetical protein
MNPHARFALAGLGIRSLAYLEDLRCARFGYPDLPHEVVP